MMKDAFEKLWEFHEVYDCARSKVPALPDNKTRNLRLDLLQEEFQELYEAEVANDIVEIADALGDILYIALGTGVAYGLPLDEVFNEIHRSNMSKLGLDGKPILREDRKVLKGPLYTPPAIEAIIERAKLKANTTSD